MGLWQGEGVRQVLVFEESGQVGLYVYVSYVMDVV